MTTKTQLTLQKELDRILLEVFEVGYQQGLAGQTGAVKLMLSNHARYQVESLFTQALTSLKREMEEAAEEQVEASRDNLKYQVENTKNIRLIRYWEGVIFGEELIISECQRVIDGYLK